MKIGFIGSGKVGCSLGKLYSVRGIHVTGYYNQHIESAKEAAAFVGCAVFATVDEVVKNSDTVLITVPDGKIGEVCEQINPKLFQGKVIGHCSGSLSASECLSVVSSHGGQIISMHPLYPVSTKFDSYEGLSDAFFVLEGSPEACVCYTRILSDIGLKVGTIQKEDKVKYHAACAVASNLVCGVVEESLRLLLEAGFSREDGLKAITPLLKSNMDRILAVGPVEALTGPMERGDKETIEKHIQCLATSEEQVLYKAISRILLQMAKERHPDRTYDEIERILFTEKENE